MEARATRTRAAVQPPSPAAPMPAPVAPRRVVVRLWLPLTPLFVLLAPFALALALVGYLVPPRLRPDPIRAVLALGRVLLALSGTVVHVDTREALVHIRIL